MRPDETSPAAGSEATPTLGALFGGFLKIGLMGFGGVGPIARHIIVTERGWLDDRGYARLIGLCQALPGANTVNAAVMIGDRYRGVTGALACVVALMAVPLLSLVALATVYDMVAGQRWAQVALTGAAASAAGLIIGTAARLISRAELALWGWGVAALALVAVGVLRWPLPTVLAVLVPLSLVVATIAARRR